MSHQDTLQRFIFDNAPARGALVRLDNSWQAVLSRRQYPEAVQRVLGQMMAASMLLAANLKFDGTLVLQIQGKGALRLAVVECNSDRTLRATAKWDGDTSEMSDSLQHLVGAQAQCVITLDPKQGQTWQGVVALEGDDIAFALRQYMQQSEQLETELRLIADDQVAAGMLLQRLPEGHGAESAWDHVVTLMQTLQDEELRNLPAKEILYRLYHEDSVRVFDTEPLHFACRCSRERVSDMLKMLGGQEVGEVILEQGSVDIACDFCNQHYVFDEEDANALFDFDVVSAAKEARH